MTAQHTITPIANNRRHLIYKSAQRSAFARFFAIIEQFDRIARNSAFFARNMSVVLEIEWMKRPPHLKARGQIIWRIKRGSAQ